MIRVLLEQIIELTLLELLNLVSITVKYFLPMDFYPFRIFHVNLVPHVIVLLWFVQLKSYSPEIVLFFASTQEFDWLIF